VSPTYFCLDVYAITLLCAPQVLSFSLQSVSWMFDFYCTKRRLLTVDYLCAFFVGDGGDRRL
jgi:hypothetical protein